MSRFWSDWTAPIASLNSNSVLGARDERHAAGEFALESLHEVRNPLEALSYLNFLALESFETPEEVRKYLLLAEEQIAMLIGVTKRTMDFAGLAGPPKPVDLVAIAEAALRIHRRTIKAKRIHLVRDLPDEFPADCHAGRMLQVLTHLVANALDALPEGGKLSIRLSRRQGHLHLIVADNGHGIVEDHRERLFERFFTTKGDAGNGLGLALSKRIVEEHNGTLSFRTTDRTGRSGTAFKICIPA